MTYFHFPKDSIVTQTIELDAAAPNTIIAGENSEIVLIETFKSDSATQYTREIALEIIAEKNAKIHYAKIYQTNLSASLATVVTIQQKQNSSVHFFSIAQGALAATENITVYLEERGAECFINGFYPLKYDAQTSKHHIHIHHRAEHTKSDMLYKGVLDKKSRAEFLGKVLVQPNAQHISAQQQNHNLLLSRTAEVNTKPELEIYADDVKCSHGATVGQLDEDKLFYLRARGISQQQAMQLLISAFAADVVTRIAHPHIKQHVTQLLSEVTA